jgi:putative ABC transport system ATP-binding protein
MEVMGVFQSLNEQGITIVMVTHELDIANFAKRKVIMRDGMIRTDEAVSKRFHAPDALAQLQEEQRAVQLT